MPEPLYPIVKTPTLLKGMPMELMQEEDIWLYALGDNKEESEVHCMLWVNKQSFECLIDSSMTHNFCSLFLARELLKLGA